MRFLLYDSIDTILQYLSNEQEAARLQLRLLKEELLVHQKINRQMRKK